MCIRMHNREIKRATNAKHNISFCSVDFHMLHASVSIYGPSRDAKLSIKARERESSKLIKAAAGVG